MRESLVNLLTSFGQRVGLPKSPSVSEAEPLLADTDEAPTFVLTLVANHHIMLTCVLFFLSPQLCLFLGCGFLLPYGCTSLSLLSLLKWVFYVDHQTGKVISTTIKANPAKQNASQPAKAITFTALLFHLALLIPALFLPVPFSSNFHLFTPPLGAVLLVLSPFIPLFLSFTANYPIGPKPPAHQNKLAQDM